MVEKKIHSAITHISLDLLTDILKLPKEWKIVDIDANIQARFDGNFRVRIVGPGLPETKPGEMFHEVKLRYRKEDNEVIFDGFEVWK